MTTLTATAYPGTPAYVQLDVLSAPARPASAYTSDFSAGLDSWSAGGAGVSLTNDPTAPASLVLRTAAGGLTEVTAARSLSGLTVGAAYRFRVKATKERGEVKLIARESTGLVVASSAFLAPTAAGTYLELIFTPTQTTMVVQLNVKQTVALYVNGVSSKAGYRFTDVTVTPSGAWLGTKIYRTDANGTDVPVRNPRPFDVDPPSTGVTLFDYEAALVGVISYRVVDGLGGVATATTWHGEVRRNAAPNPRVGVNLTGWSATYGTTGVGALTRVATGGPLPAAPTFARATWTTAQTVSNASFGIGSAAAGASEIPVAPAVPASFAAYLRPSIAGQTWRLRANFYTAAGALISSIDGPNVALTANTWQAVIVDTPATPGTTARVFLQLLQVSGISSLVGIGGTVDASAVLAGPTGDYLDGDMAGNAWTSTAHASPSVELDAERAGYTPTLSIPTTAMVPANTSIPTAVKVPMVTGYNARREFNGSLHTILGASYRIANPGPLMLRTGTLDVFANDYAQAEQVAALLESGATLYLAQPTHPGLDLFFVGRSVEQNPAGSGSARWIVSIAYDEVPAP